MFIDLKELHFFHCSARKMLSVIQVNSKAWGIKVAASVDLCIYPKVRVLQLISVGRRNKWSQVHLLMSCLFMNGKDQVLLLSEQQEWKGRGLFACSSNPLLYSTPFNKIASFNTRKLRKGKSVSLFLSWPPVCFICDELWHF